MEVCAAIHVTDQARPPVSGGCMKLAIAIGIKWFEHPLEFWWQRLGFHRHGGQVKVRWWDCWERPPTFLHARPVTSVCS